MSITIKTHGEYYFKNDREKGKKVFTQDIKAPSLEFFRQTSVRYTGTDDEGKLTFKENVFINVRGVIKKKLLPILLQRRLSDFARVRSVTIDEIVSDDKNEVLDLPVTLQSKSQLAHLIKTKKMPLDVDSYMDIDELRSDILEYQEDADTFVRNAEKRNKRRSEELEFMRLNGLTDVPTSTIKGAPEKSKPALSITDL